MNKAAEAARLCKHHVRKHVLEAGPQRHAVMALLALSGLLAFAGLEWGALGLGWLANLVWIYET